MSVHYADTPEHAEERGLPLLEGTTGCTDGHLMVVRGFETGEDGTEYVLVNDPYAPGDAAAQRRYRLDQFAHAWAAWRISFTARTARAPSPRPSV